MPPLCRVNATSSPGRLLVWAHQFVGGRQLPTTSSDALFLAMVASSDPLTRRMGLATMPYDVPERVAIRWMDLFMSDDSAGGWESALHRATGCLPPEILTAVIRACPQTDWSQRKRDAFARVMAQAADELDGNPAPSTR